MKKNTREIPVLFVIIVALVVFAIGFLLFKTITKKDNDYEIEVISEYKYFIVKDKDKYGVINDSGEKIIDAKYNKIDIPNPSKDIFICHEGNRVIALNSNSNQLFPEYNSVSAIELKNTAIDVPYEKNTLRIEKAGKYGLIDFSGNRILELEYDNIDNFSDIEGLLLIQKNEKYGIANLKGKIIIKPEYDSISSDKYYEENELYKYAGFIVGRKNQDELKYGYINYNGKIVLKNEYSDISRINDIDNEDGLYFITSIDKKIGVMKNKKKLINNEYQSITYNKSKMFIVEKNGLNGVINISGKEIISPENTNIEIKGEYIYVQKNNLNEVYNVSGEKQEFSFNKTIEPTLNDKYKITTTKENDRTYYGVMNSDNKQIINEDYLYIEYAFENYFIVRGKNGKLGLIDSDGKTKIDLKYDMTKKIQGKEIIEVLSNDTKNVEIYNKNIEKVCEMKDAIIDIEKDYIKVYADDGLEYFDNEGNSIKSSLLFPANKIYARCKDGKWGYVDSNGKIVVDFRYDYANEINRNGFGAIKKDDKWGCINSDGKIIVEPSYKLYSNYGDISFIGEYHKVNSGIGRIYYTKDY